MECRITNIFILLTFMISKSIQQQPSVDCQRDTRLFFGQDRFYSSGIKYKCTFSNINSVDDMKEVLTSNSISTQTIASITFNQSNLSEFPDRMFMSYSSLRSLDGSNLRLGNITSNLFGNNIPVNIINLSFNQLASLPSKVFANRKLNLLDLSSNYITSIDESAFSGSEIDKINLSHNKIKDLTFVNSFKFFNVLQMNNNEVERFDQVMLTSGNWNTVRDAFIAMQNPSINLGNNKLKSFVCKSPLKFTFIEIKNNPDLKNVDLGECTIGQLDVSDCENLKSIKFGDNLLGFTAKNVKFDDIDFSKTRSLESLKLINNSLNANSLNAIMKLENLTTLDISYNVIGPLNISTLAKLKNLSTLGLKSTQISNIQFGTFSHQNNVRMLDISDNNLGSFDMQMIFSMSSLTYLDISGNDLIELSNIDAAHNTFALLEKIDLTNNKWTCSYLLRLIKIMRAYRVTLVQSYVEEHKSNINGIYCRHIEGDDTIIEPLSPNTSNITDIREKMNEIVSQLTKESQYRSDMEARLSAIEAKVDNQVTLMVSNEALRSNKGIQMHPIEVRNGTLFEMTLIVVFCCFIVFISLKILVFVRTNFLHKPRPIRNGMSENILTMNIEDY